MNNLKEIIVDVKKIVKDEELEISDEIMFDACIRMYNSSKIQSHKNGGGKYPLHKPYSPPAYGELETKMKELGIRTDIGLTVEQARDAINKRLKVKKE